jgi:adenylylsulfate kinase-like enzyme
MANSNLNGVLNFRDATRQQAKASILIEGLSGRGKSGLALLLGHALAGKDWTKVFAVDTENRSLDLFEGINMSSGAKCEPFKKVDLLPAHGFAPSNYLMCKENAIAAGGEVIINDSITHMWQQEGGVLDIVSNIQLKDSKRYNNYTAWGAPEVKAEKQAIYNVVRDARIHVISTVRVKEKFEINSDHTLTSLGEQEQQMPDLKYEPDLVLQMQKAGAMNGTPPIAKVIKSRYAVLQEGEVYQFTDAIIDSLVDYLHKGTDPKELLEKQRQDYIATISNILKEDVSKKTMFPILKEQQGHKDTKLADLPLDVLQTLLGSLLA